MLLLICCVSFILLIVKYFLKWRNFFALASKIPSPKGHIPIIGVLPHLFGKDLHGIFENYMSLARSWKDQNGLGKFWCGLDIFVFIDTPERMQKILNAEECLAKPRFFKFFGLEQGSLFGTVEAWRSHRKIFNPAFSLKTLKSFLPMFNKKSRKFIASLDSYCEGPKFDIFPHFSAFFLEAILDAAFDLDVDILNHTKREKYVKHFDDFYSAVTSRIGNPFLHFDTLYKMSRFYKMEIDGRTSGSLNLTDEIFENGKLKNITGNSSAIKLLMDPKYQLSDEEIKQEITTLLVAAQDSTTIIMSSAVLMLAMNKNVQEKLFKELHSVFKYDDEITFDALNNLPYLEMVIKETLRLFPISVLSFRTATSDFELDGYKIPAGANFLLSIFMLHRDKTYWGEDAELFVPERFEPERIKNVHRYAYIPFSAGVRQCIGSKYAMLFMKTCLTRFLLRFEVETSLKYEQLEFRISVTLKILQKVEICLKHRKK